MKSIRRFNFQHLQLLPASERKRHSFPLKAEGSAREKTSMTSQQKKRKVGLKRIDAALDALCPMGFSRDLVRKTVKNLLKVYGGDQCWTFIEEASYKVVIDAILEAQESQEKAGLEYTQPNLLDRSPSKVESLIESLPPDSQTLQDDSQCITGTLYIAGKNLSAEVHSQSQHTHSEAPMNSTHSSLQDTSEHKVTAENCRTVTGADTGSPGMCSGPAMGSHSIKKRKPCYGWICDDDDSDDEDLVYLTPDPKYDIHKYIQSINFIN